MKFVERAIAAAGLGSIVADRARGDVASVAARLGRLAPIDLLLLGAVADSVRVAEMGNVVRVHTTESAEVTWIREAATELDLLRAVALARITGPLHTCVGVDWGTMGLELAQVALGFGATDLVGPITRKSGLLILEDDRTKQKGQGLVATASLRRQEIAALVTSAGRECEWVPGKSTTVAEVAHA